MVCGESQSAWKISSNQNRLVMADQRSKISAIEIDFNPFDDSNEIVKTILTNESQREIWLSCIIGGEPANLAYNESVSLELTGEFNLDCFRKALLKVVKRHEALRSVIGPNGEHFIIYGDILFDFEIKDLTSYCFSEQKEFLNEFVKSEIKTPFNIEVPPLFKFHLHKLSTQQYYFTIVIHHIIADGWSLGVILEDLSKYYNGYLKGMIANLQAASQISDYALKEASFIKSDLFRKTESFWLDFYKNDIPILDLPADFPRPVPRSYKANRIEQLLSAKLVDQLKVIGAKSGCSFVNTLLSAFEIFLSFKTGKEDVIIGLPSAGQSAAEMFNLVGHCVNLMPLRSTIESNSTFSEYLKKRKTAFFDAYDHQQISFGQLIKKLNLKRDPSRIPLVPVMFNIDMGMGNTVSFDHLEHRLISNPREYETFEIFLNATESQGTFILEWTYNTQLFKASTIRLMMEEFESLLISLCKNPDNELIESFPKNTIKSSLVDTKNKDSILKSARTFIELIDEIGNQYPDKTAVNFKNSSLSYRLLIEKSNQLASLLVEKGIRTGDVVGLSVDRSLEMIIALIGILKSGATYLPLDPKYPVERVEFMLKDSSTKVLLTSKTYKGRYHINAREIIVEEIWPLLNQYNKNNLNQPDFNALAYILYTSGSTGNPKGVKISHQNLINFLSSMKNLPGMDHNDRLLAVTTISFDIAGLELYLPLICGAEVFIADYEQVKDGRLLLNLIEEKKISVMQATPSSWQMIIDSGWNKKYNLKVLTGGEALSNELARQLLALSDEVWNMYGPTETTIWSTIKQITSNDKLITIGSPIQNTQVYILDENLNELPVLETGEIYIGGNGVAEGYLNNPQLTNEKFIADPYSHITGSKLYRTGDLGKLLDNGEFQCLGRIDQQVKIRGHRIELGEIEAKISSLDDIKQSVVVVREDTLMGKRLVAYIVLNNSSEENNDLSWREELRAILPGYMIPQDFVVLRSFPLTPNAKIDRNALPEIAGRSIKKTDKDILPITRNEQIIANIWTNVLGIEGIKISDDFFELGGHSILAVKVMVAIKKETGKRLPISALFENSTIEKLAVQLSKEEQSERWESIVPLKIGGNKSPVFLIHGGGLNILSFKSIIKHFTDDQPIYGIQALGLSNETVVPPSIEEISKTHLQEILKIHPDGPFALAGYSLGGFIAFEIAKQLKKMGKEVKMLGVIDTYVYDLHQHKPMIKPQANLKRQFQKILFTAKSFYKYPKDAVPYRFKLITNKLNTLIFSKEKEEKKMLSDYEKYIYEIYSKAINDYVLVPSKVRVTLFRVEKRLYHLDDLVYLGWNKFALDGVEILKIPGDHRTCLYSPNDKAFAGILQKTLDKD